MSFAYNNLKMEIDHLRTIGRDVLREISSHKHSPESGRTLGKGAAGDKTFQIDKYAEDIIVSALRESGEPLTVISEEAGVFHINHGGTRVIVDPIDGSKNAVAGLPYFCCSIALAEGERVGDIRASYVINLNTGDEFWAEKDAGAFLNGKKISSQTDDEFHVVAYEAQSPKRDIPRIFPLLAKSMKTRCLGAIALDLAYLALGSVSVFISPSPSRSFDFAGGLLLVKEAGGIITDLEGNSLDDIVLGLQRSAPLLAAANAVLHEKALGSLKGSARE